MLQGFTTRLAAATATALSVPSSTSALQIDDFSTAQTLPAAVMLDPEVTDQVTGAGILGGERDAYLALTSGTSTTLTVNSGVASHNEAAGSDSQMWFTWDGPDNDFPIDHVGLGGIDLTESGSHNAITVQILLNTQPATDLGFLVHTSAADYSIVTFSAPSGASTQTIPFAEFSPLAGLGADFTNIGAVSFFSIEAVPGQSIGFGTIETTAIPEPASGVLLAIGLLGLASWRRASLCTAMWRTGSLTRRIEQLPGGETPKA